MKRIYLDYASLTPIDPRVLREMKKFSAPEYANPSSIYKEGVAAKKAMDEGRARIAGLIHAHPDEIVFTSGGTEANGLVLEGCGRVAHRSGNAKPHLIISSIEHSSVIETAAMMEKHGVTVTRLAVDKNGLISLDELKKSITPNTYLVSIMTVNNEIGTIQSIREIAKIIRKARADFGVNSTKVEPQSQTEVPPFAYPLFHTDAAQAFLYEELFVEKLGVDFMTLDGSKVYGPRGIGALYVKRGTPIEQIIYGGGQERGLRSGTENLPAIMGFAKALEIADRERENEARRVSELKDFFLDGLMNIVPGATINPPLPKNDGKTVKSPSPHILNVSIPGIDNEFFVLQLDAKGIACSTKSSCLRDEDESYVLKAMGGDSQTSVRFSFGRWTTKGDLKKVFRTISEIIKK